MLKIKDNVKLSPLKKWGFVREGRKYVLDTYTDGYGYFAYEETAAKITVESNRTITFNVGVEFNPENYTCLNSEKWADGYIISKFVAETLYVLIKADLVEKIDD